MILLLFSLLLVLVKPSIGQNSEMLQDTGFVKRPVFISVLNLQPLTLSKNRLLFSFQAEYPEFYKYLNSKNGKTEQVSETTVLNEAYYYGRAVYGLTDRINLFTLIPLASIHHFSPTTTITDKGFGDFAIGGNYSLLESKNFKNNLTSSLTVAFPTGKFKNIGANDYPLGLGAYTFKGDLTGLHRFRNLDVIYSAYYEYRTGNSQGLNVGDEAGASISFQKQYNTKYGNFGLEGGAYGFWNLKDQKDGLTIPYTDDYNANLFVGAWYNYLKDFYLRFGVPYTIYQNKSWLTKYTVLIQLDYYFDLKKTK